MAYKTPEQIKAFLDGNMHRMDQPAQVYGDEPNSYRKPWETASVRCCLFACWAYEQAAGNLAIPTVYRAINEYRDSFLCDRSYFPATPRDLRAYEKFSIPIFGIESRHQLTDYDVIGTSISYPVLSINFIKQLMMSDIPPLWSDRHQKPEEYPMVMVGGQLYGAPEVCANIADVIFCGEVEDEPGNPGIGAVFSRIESMKKANLWQTKRLWCYEELAKEFNFLYFPCFIDVIYGYENRPSVDEVACAWEKKEVFPSKQVIGYYSRVPDMRLPIRKRIVKDLNAVAPLDNPPLLYVDPGMGANDVEVQRGCPAWCTFPLALNEKIITYSGVHSIGDLIDSPQEVWAPEGWVKGWVEAHGEHVTQEITFEPAYRPQPHHSWQKFPGSSFTRTVIATPCHGWPLVDNNETHNLQVGDVVPATAVREILDEEQHALGWVHGFLFGDGHQRFGSQGLRQPESSGSFMVRMFGAKDGQHVGRFERYLSDNSRNSWAAKPFKVTSISRPEWAKGDSVIHGWAPFNTKSWPVESGADYLTGFLSGWMAADAWPSHSDRSNLEDTWMLDAVYKPSHHGDITPRQWLENYAASAGWILVGVSEQVKDTNYGPRNSPLVRHTLKRADQIAWRVQSIEELKSETVACLTVPESHRFALASGIGSLNCALTYRQKPYRQRSVDYTVDFAERLLKNTGGLHIAPFGPDFPMHTQKKKLISELLEKVTDEVDASSMRVDDFIADPSYILLQAHGGMDTVTLGVEGNSQRMRDLVGKGSSDEDIREAVARGIQAGIKKFKLYMIASLPGEDEQDIYRILQLAKDLADIRDQMGSTARLQFSWTPMLIEGNTPFQWFAPTTANWALGDVWESFRELKVDFKLGGKAEKNKLAYFQATQRASREVGLALAEAAIQLNKGCWGGAPAGLYDLIEERLVAHGFLNGLVDIYDERQKKDLFGWEMIDQGINTELLWVTYQQMREFLENTSADTYDEQFGEDYHGAEWVERCDTRCMGKTCGVCDAKDLQIRRGYVQAAAGEIDVDLSKVKVIDQRSLQMKIRCRVEKADEKRFVDNSHFRYAVRRAASIAGVPVTKRHVRFSSDAVKIKNWASGADYLEFGLTKVLSRDALEPLMAKMNDELSNSGGSMRITDWVVRPSQGDELRADVDLSLYEIEMDLSPEAAMEAIDAWMNASYIPMVFKEETRAGIIREEVNGKDYVADLWVVRKGHRLCLRSLVRGKANPYQVLAALLGRPSWIELAQYPAHRIEAFLEIDNSAIDFFRPSCEDCENPVPITPLDLPYSQQRCPRCLDVHQGLLMGRKVVA